MEETLGKIEHVQPFSYEINVSQKLNAKLEVIPEVSIKIIRHIKIDNFMETIVSTDLDDAVTKVKDAIKKLKEL